MNKQILFIICSLLILSLALDGALNAILDIEAIVAEIVSMAVLKQVSSKFSRLSASFRVSLTLLRIYLFCLLY
jgi:hypothetical protein